MNIRLLQRLSILCGGLLVLAAPAAHAQTRAAPIGDNVGAPTIVVPNGSQTVIDAEFATLEAPATEVTICDEDSSSSHSVWFRFTLPSDASIDIDSGGTLLDLGTSTDTSVVLSLYQSVGLTEVDCTSGTAARLTSAGLIAGTYLVRLASDTFAEPSEPSQYRLSVRVRIMHQFMQDSDFDDHPLGVVWKVKNAGDPPQIFRTCAPDCVVRFNGVAGGKLQQSAALDTIGSKFKVGDLLQARASINGTQPAGSDVKLTLKITYSNGTPATKVSDTLEITLPATDISALLSVYAEIESKAVKSAKVTISSPDADDTFNVVFGGLSMTAGTSVRNVPLSLPKSP